MSGAVIHVGAAVPGFEAFADFLDGNVATLHRVHLTITDDGTPQATLVIRPPEGRAHLWPLDQIRMVPDQAGDDGLVLRHANDPVARLILRENVVAVRLRARCRNLRRRPVVRGRGRLAAWAVAAVASVVAIVFLLIPVMANQLAEFLPPEGEKALGDTTFEQIRTALDDTGFAPLRVCDAPEGVAALEAMRDRLTAHVDLPYPLTVHVLDHGMINAFALPGGYVVFFRGLIEEAEDPDEVAAVFAHEIGHVVNRDPTRIALRSAGSVGVLGLLFGDFAGGAIVLFLTERLVQATYTREAEEGADAFAHELLTKARISPAALASMFERLRERYGDEEGIVAHFMSHPAMRDRIEAARIAAQSGTNFEPSLNDAEWQALRTICGEHEEDEPVVDQGGSANYDELDD